MKKKFPNKDIITLDEILDIQYGKKGTPKRDRWEKGFQKFLKKVLKEELHL